MSLKTWFKQGWVDIGAPKKMASFNHVAEQPAVKEKSKMRSTGYQTE